ncbi:MAG: lactonase family protein [Pirellulales bacterium]
MSLAIAICLAAIRPLRLRNRFRSLLAASASGLLVGLCLLPSATVAQQPTAPYSGRVWVFIGTYTSGKSEGIYRAQLDLKSGELTQTELAAKVENPSFLALHPNGRFLYAAGELSNFEGKPGGAVSAFALDGETGKLALLNQQSSRGAGPCHLVVDPSGKNVLVANYGGGSVAVLPIGEDGRLQPASSFIQHEGKSVNARRQDAPHAHSINVDKAGAFAVAADLGLDKLLVYRFNPEQGRLTANDPPHASVAAGAGPRHFAFHPSGRFAYVINEMHSTVTAFDYDSKQGRLVQLQTLSTLPAPQQGNSTAEVQVHPSGKFLYGSNRGHNSLAIFAIDQGTGRLTPIGHQETGGKTPRNFGIDPTGSFVVAANQASDSVVVFRVNQTTGKLSPTGHSVEAPTPVCVKFVGIPR